MIHHLVSIVLLTGIQLHVLHQAMLQPNPNYLMRLHMVLKIKVWDEVESRRSRRKQTILGAKADDLLV